MNIIPNHTPVRRIADGREGIVVDSSWDDEQKGWCVVRFPNDSEMGYVDRVVASERLETLDPHKAIAAYKEAVNAWFDR